MNTYETSQYQTREYDIPDANLAVTTKASAAKVADYGPQTFALSKGGPLLNQNIIKLYIKMDDTVLLQEFKCVQHVQCEYVERCHIHRTRGNVGFQCQRNVLHQDKLRVEHVYPVSILINFCDIFKLIRPKPVRVGSGTTVHFNKGHRHTLTAQTTLFNCNVLSAELSKDGDDVWMEW